MPTYQYACTACAHQLEAVQTFSDAPLTACPECDGKLRKVFSAVGVVFKGSGFYRTDSRRGNGEGRASSDSSQNGAGTKPDKAPAAKDATSAKPDSSPKSESKKPSTASAAPAKTAS